MTKIIYDGEKQECRLKVGSMIVNRWKKGEVKDIDDALVDRLLTNTDFTLANSSVIKKEEVETEEVFDYKNADKDALLDFTALNDISADYTMSNKELRQKIKEFLN